MRTPVCSSLDPQVWQKYIIGYSDESFIANKEPKIQIMERKSLGSEINRARYCEINPALIASSHVNGEIILTHKGEVLSKLICHTQ